MSKPRILVFASGSKDGGGSGFQELVENSITGVLQAEIVGVISNWKKGGVFKKAKKLGIPFLYMPLPREAEDYQALVKKFSAEWVCLSGWLKLVKGLDPTRTINIHPAVLPGFGGPDMFGHRAHEAVIAAFKQDEITKTALTMHFVTEPKDKDDYDKGPIFFHYPVLIREDDDADSLGTRVNKIEHGWQSYITNLVVHGKIRLEGRKVIVPEGYPWLPK